MSFYLTLPTDLSTIAPWNTLLPFIAAVIAFAITAALTPLIIRLALARGWVANPHADRWHSTRTPLMGGLGIFAGATLTAATIIPGFLGVPGSALARIAIAAALMFVTGMVDDRWGINPAGKIILQIVAAVIVISGGHWFSFGLGPWIGVPVTIMWLIGITNAVNLVDNMDGLSAGVSAIASVSIAAIAFIADAPELAAAALALGGAAAGFLLFNFKPARIFMGDCGSLFLGFSLAALAVAVQEVIGMRGLLAVVMTAMILAVPIMDTTLVTIMRSLAGRPVSEGGRDHASHRLVFAGLSDTRAVIVLYSIAAVFGVLAVWFYLVDTRLRISIGIFSLLAAALFAHELGALNVYGTASGGGSRQASNRPRSVVGRLLSLPDELFGPKWKPVFVVLVDALTVVAAFVAAHVLRFGPGINPARDALMRQALPVVLVARLPVFAAFGLYRAIWRHAGALEFLRIIVAVTAGSFVVYAGIALVSGIDAISDSVLVISWMATILGLLMTRFGFRGLQSFLVSQNRHGTPVAVYGCADDAAAAVRYLRHHSQEFGLKPVAFINDSDTATGSILRGLPVASGLGELDHIREKLGVEEVVLPHNNLAPDELRDIARICRKAGVRCRRLNVTLESELLADAQKEKQKENSG